MVVQQAPVAFDAAKVSKRFYRQFQQEHASFASAITGLPDPIAQTRYASVLLRRLMVIYFLQGHGLLNNNLHYLRQHLDLLRTHAPPAAGPFYRQFLLRLVYEGLGQPSSLRTQELLGLLGAVPYLPNGLFAIHALERCHPAISLPDAAFCQVFDFFDQYRWRLDQPPGDAQNTLTPDLLGTIFEKYINNKQLGAYYTSADITEYISTNSLIPWLLDRAAAQAPQAFAPAGPIWSLLSQQPDRYIYPAVRHGIDLDLPTEIAAGLSEVPRRTAWNTPAPPEYGLPAETWREYLARRQRCHELRTKLATGRISSSNDLITYNLDLRQFANDVIATCPQPDTLRAIYSALTQVTVLDPTCGSGAFLLAALAILAPLHAACLERMHALLAAVDQAADLADFSAIVSSASPLQPHAAPSAFILRSIMVNNLYGVDLLDAAVELCKLRLLLKLIACAETPAELEDLPNLDANIRTGNALVGFGASAADQPAEIARWRSTYRPFHWLAEFAAIVVDRGGFDVIIGNPPYLGYARVKGDYCSFNYTTAPCGNLYALTVERSLDLLGAAGRLGMIVPIASVSTHTMAELQHLYQKYPTWHSHFAVRPGKLFADVDMNLTITLLQYTPAAQQRCSTSYRRWSAGVQSDRATLFERLHYTAIPALPDVSNPFPKLGSALEIALLEKLLAFKTRLGCYATPDGQPIYYHSGGRYWRKALTTRLSSHYRLIKIRPEYAAVVFNLLNSQLFYWYWIVNSNCMDVVAREVNELPVFPFEQVDQAAFARLQAELLHAYFATHTTRQRRGELISGPEINFDVAKAKPIIDQIDTLLAHYYGLSAEELDFILNYDIKYRVRL